MTIITTPRICYVVLLFSIILTENSNQCWADQLGSPEGTLAEIAKQDPSRLSESNLKKGLQILEGIVGDDSVSRATRYKAAKLLYLYSAVGKPGSDGDVLDAARMTIQFAESEGEKAESKIALVQELIARFPCEGIDALKVKSAYIDAINAIEAYQAYAVEVRKNPVASLPVEEVMGHKFIQLPALNHYEFQQWSLVRSFTNFLIRQGDVDATKKLVLESIQTLSRKHEPTAEDTQDLVFFELKAYHLALDAGDFVQAIEYLSKLDAQAKQGKCPESLEALGQNLIRMAARADGISAEKLDGLEQALIAADLSQLVMPLWLQYVQRVYAEKEFKAVEKLSKDLLVRLKKMKSGDNFQGNRYFPDEFKLAAFEYNILKMLNAGLTGQERFTEARAVDLVMEKLGNKYKIK